MTPLLITRQYLEDLTGYFMPLMIEMIEARIRLNAGTEMQLPEQVCLSVMEELEQKLIRKTLTASNKFTIKLNDGEAALLYTMLMKFPIPADQFWRVNMRQQITSQLHNQLV